MLGQHVQRGADVDAGARLEAGAAEALARHLGVARLAVDRIELARLSQAAQDGQTPE